MYSLKEAAKAITDIVGGKKDSERGSRKETSEKYPVSERNQTASTDTKVLASKPTARIVMRKEIHHFTDLLEPLYAISKGQLSQNEALEIFEKWKIRIGAQESADKLSQKWEMFTGGIEDAGLDALSDMAFRWINQMASFGISRDVRDEVQVNEAVKCAYIESSGQPPIIGERMLIKRAAWFLDTDVICQGILTKEKGT